MPNAKIPFPKCSDDMITSFATRDITAGEEITFCDLTDFEGKTRYERHQALAFTCDCKACRTDIPSQQLSDMRRRLIRGRHYLTYGKDMDGQKHDSTSPITVDSNLKKTAEESRIPFSTRIIYILLKIYLPEEEGLLDDSTGDTVFQGILQTADLFQTERNAKIIRIAMAQPTWLERFGVAFRIFGKADLADPIAIKAFRKFRRLSEDPEPSIE